MKRASEIKPEPTPYGVVKLREIPNARPDLEIVWLHPGGLTETAIPITQDDAFRLACRILNVTQWKS